MRAEGPRDKHQPGSEWRADVAALPAEAGWARQLARLLREAAPSPGRQRGSGRGYCGPGSASKDVASEPGSVLTMVRPQVGRAALWLCRGSGCRPEKRSSGRSGPATPDRSLGRFASCQDGGPKPRLQPETAWVKGRGAGPTGSFWVPVNSVLR